MDVSALSPTIPDGTHVTNEATAYTYVKTTVARGSGWFTRRAFKKGEVVEKNGRMGMLAGEEKNWRNLHYSRVNELSSQRREYFYRWCIILDLDGNYTFPIEFQSGATNPSCYCNHSCDPNLWFDGDSDAIIARRDIMADEELTIDYAMFDFDFGEEFECKCGSGRCRKRIKADDWCTLAADYWPHYPSIYKKVVRAQLESSQSAQNQD